MTFIAIMLGGGVGATLRGVLTNIINKLEWTAFPVATLIVNLMGCFIFGVLSPVIITHQTIYFLIFVGILGGFTTFSTLQLDLITMIQHRQWCSFTMLFLLQYIGGLIAIILGYQCALILL